MKKTAVLIYNSFCNFEFSVALEILALAEKEVVIFAHTKEAVKSEDGLMVLPNQTISEINIDEYDSLILPGAMDIREAIENEEIKEAIIINQENEKIKVLYKILNKFILTTNTATREALIDYSKKSYIVSNDDAGVEDAIKFAVKNYKQKNNQYNQYVYKNDRIIEKIEKMIEENKKHPDRISKII